MSKTVNTSRWAAESVAKVVFFLLLLALLIASVVPSFVRSRVVISKPARINNLHAIAAAKKQWAADHGKINRDAVVVSEVNQRLPFVATNLPCPCGGVYTYNPIGIEPECSCGPSRGWLKQNPDYRIAK